MRFIATSIALAASVAAQAVGGNASLPSASGEATKPIDQRSPDFTYTGGRVEWLKSWHKGENYVTRSEYEFDVRLKAVPNELAPATLKNIAEWSAKGVSAVERAKFSGVAIATTQVCHEHPQLRLIRDYTHVVGNGVWAGELIPTSDEVKAAIGAVVKADLGNKKQRDDLWDTFSNPIFAAIGKRITDITIKWAKENIGEPDENGIVHVSTNSVIVKALGLDARQKIMDIVTQFSKEVNEKKFTMSQSGSRHFSAREIRNVSISERPDESLVAFDKSVSQGVDPTEKAKAAMMRETATPTKDLFDGSIRKPGDVWTVDATIFNSFLHPDLQGAIQGVAVIRYVEDQEGEENGYYSDMYKDAVGVPRRYDVRKLEVVNSSVVGDVTRKTDFSYDERSRGGRLFMRYDSSSSMEILVDKASGHIVYATLHFVADPVEELPNLALTKGWKANGRGVMDVTFLGDVLP